MTRYIGIDPGLSGAVAFYDAMVTAIDVHDMPTVVLKKGKGTKRYINYGVLAKLVHSWVQDGRIRGFPEPIAYVEQVGAMPGQGIASAFDFGRSFGAALMACHANWIRVEQVSPTVWKRAVGIPVGAGKDQSRAKAMNLFPLQASLFERVKDDGRADAALVAYFGATRLQREYI